MNHEALSAQAPTETNTLTIGDLAQRTGLTPATLRVWESRRTRRRTRLRQAAQQLDHPEAVPLLYELADNPAPPPVALLQAASLLNRVVAYVDRVR